MKYTKGGTTFFDELLKGNIKFLGPSHDKAIFCETITKPYIENFAKFQLEDVDFNLCTHIISRDPSIYEYEGTFKRFK